MSFFKTEAVMKRTGVCLLAAALLGLLAGCGSPKEEQAQSAERAPVADGTDWQLSETGSLGELPLTSKKGGDTLVIAGIDNYDRTRSFNNTKLPVWEEIQRITGVKIKWEVLPSSQYVDAMQARIAAGSKLPDLMRVPDELAQVIKQKAVIPLNDLIDKHGPNIKYYFKENPRIKKMATSPDGNIYALSSVVSGVVRAQVYTWAIRADWLKKLGLSEPTTIDELYAVLKAFREKDPNGNGKKDEIPYTSTGGATTTGIWEVFELANAWGLHIGEYSDGLWPDENGKIQYHYVDPRMKEFLSFAHKLFQEGLLDADFLNTQGSAARNDKINKNVVGMISSYTHNFNTFENGLKAAGVTDADYAALGPLVANSEVKPFREVQNGISGYYTITKDCKDPELAIKFLDYVYASERANRFTTWGIEGTSYIVKDGKLEYTDFVLKNPEGKSAFLALASLGCYPPTLPTIRNDSGVWSGHGEALNKLNPVMRLEAEKLGPYLVDAVPIILPTEEEAKILAKIDKAGFSTYRDEMLTKFVTGDESIDKFEEYVETMKSLGLDEFIRIRRQQYERFTKG